ncbi:MAG: type II toxin-antitoxin system RelE/ParE family toxin [bacterium]
MTENKYTINYLPSAKKDLNNIISYIQADDPSAALNLLNDIDKSISQLKSFPFKGKTPEDDNLKSKDYQMLIVKNYLIFYVVFEENKEIEIRRIIHGKRKYKFLL